MEHFLIATTMLVVGLFAVLSWESTFPDQPRRSGARPSSGARADDVSGESGGRRQRAGTHAGALARRGGHRLAAGARAIRFHARSGPGFRSAAPPVRAADFPSVMNRDIAPMLRRLDLAATDGGAGIVDRSLRAWCAASDDLWRGQARFPLRDRLHHQDVHRLAVGTNGRTRELDLRDPVRELLPPGVAAAPQGFEITLLDLATHHAGLPGMPDNPAQATCARSSLAITPPISTISSSGTASESPRTRNSFTAISASPYLGRRWPIAREPAIRSFCSARSPARSA